MHQQINLYQNEFRKQRMLFSPAAVGVATVTLALGLLALWGADAYSVRAFARVVDQMNDRIALQERMAEAIGARIKNRETPEQVADQIETLSAQIAQRSAALDLLRQGAAGETKGFAPRLTALARRPMDGLWLEKLAFGDADDATAPASRISLYGRALSADLVPRYLQALATEPELQGALFDDVVLDRRASHDSKKRRQDAAQDIETPTVRFNVATRARDKEPRS